MFFTHVVVAAAAAVAMVATQVSALSGGEVHVPPVTSVCHDTCGSVLVKYPFGTGLGCGHPSFGRYVKCAAGALQLSTSTGVYAISSIDYTTSTIVITDPLMSTCTSMQYSGSFGLDSDAPFATLSNDKFVLLGCSTTSPVFDPNQDLCDAEESHVCRGIYSCKAIAEIGLEPNGPISTCCVYKGSGSGSRLDLPKLQCTSYTCVYGYGNSEGDPTRWNYGISLQFNGSDPTDACKGCEATAGTCGFRVLDESFVCACRNGVNTSTNCYGQGYSWNSSWGQDRGKTFNILGLFLFWIGLSIGRR